MSRRTRSVASPELASDARFARQRGVGSSAVGCCWPRTIERHTWSSGFVDCRNFRSTWTGQSWRVGALLIRAFAGMSGPDRS